MRLFKTALVGVAGLALTSAATAAEISLEGRDPQGLSTFSLDFGDGVPRVSEISYTEFDLRVDPDTGTARMAHYHQTAAPLELPSPFGPISTGNLIIEIVPGSSTGTFDPETNTFATNEDYVIYFDGDLSALGLTSPVVLAAADSAPTSAGGVSNTDAGLSSGDLAIAWSGVYNLDFGGGQVFPLNYNCDVSASFVRYDGCSTTGCETADLNRDCAIDLADVSGLLANYGRSGSLVAPRSGDLDGDQDVDLADLAGMLASFAVNCN